MIMVVALIFGLGVAVGRHDGFIDGRIAGNADLVRLADMTTAEAVIKGYASGIRDSIKKRGKFYMDGWWHYVHFSKKEGNK